MSSTQNTNVWTREKLTDAPLVQAPNIMNNTQQSKLITELHEAWAVAHGYRTKVQAPSCKPENLHAANSNQFVKGASSKLQAASVKPQAKIIFEFQSN